MENILHGLSLTSGHLRRIKFTHLSGDGSRSIFLFVFVSHLGKVYSGSAACKVRSLLRPYYCSGPGRPIIQQELRKTSDGEELRRVAREKGLTHLWVGFFGLFSWFHTQSNEPPSLKSLGFFSRTSFIFFHFPSSRAPLFPWPQPPSLCINGKKPLIV